MIDNLIIEAYAQMKAGLGGEEQLEKYICKQLNLPENYLSNQYKTIADRANNCSYDDYSFRKNIYREYVDLMKEVRDNGST